MLRIKGIVSLLLVVLFCAGSSVWAQTVSVKLQEGIYQETTGNLPEAMTIYAEIIENGDSTDTQAATAMFRLGMCQLMTGDKEKAAGTFKQVITRYPSESEVVEKAKNQLEKLNSGSIGKVIQVSLLEDLQEAIDVAEPNDTIILGKGTYTQPVIISKGITLRGASRTDSVFEVTADQAAISINTMGKGKTKLENLTFKWQLASSNPGTNVLGAVTVVDSRAEIEGCYFKASGNTKRCPKAVMHLGNSEVNIIRSRFEGFEHPICYNGGTRGIIQDCLIMDSGHQGVLLHAGSEVNVVGNVICGHRFHGVRSLGGKLNAKDNLVADNQYHTGFYMINNTRGSIINNVMTGNSVGVGGYAQTMMNIENNVFMGNDSGVLMYGPSFTIKNNIFQGNSRALKLHKSPLGENIISINTLWDNTIDFENFIEEPNSIRGESCFVDADHGNFALTNPVFTALNQGLTDPEIFIVLWNRWKNRTDPNEPFVIIW